MLKLNSGTIQSIFLVLLATIFSSTAASKKNDELHISLAKLPFVSESIDKGVFVDLSRAIGEEYETRYNVDIDYNIYPFSRSLQNVATGSAIFHLPFIYSKKGESVLNEMNLKYGLEPTNTVAFALYYSNKNEKIKKWITDNFPINESNELTLYTDLGHVIFFNELKIKGKSCLLCLVSLVDINRIDGLIFAAREVDSIISSKNFKNIESVFYKNFISYPVFNNSKEGDVYNSRVSEIIRKMRRDGKIDIIIGEYNRYYESRFPNEFLTIDKCIKVKNNISQQRNHMQRCSD